jgi:hypothetical protein
MDITLLKQRMQAYSKQPKKKQEKIDYAAILWKPKEGKHQIRIVPSAYDKANPFKEVFLHYGFAKWPIFALTNWGEADPIVDFVKQLRTSKDKEDWKLASKLEPKVRVFIPVVVRGEEERGTRLWEVGVTIYKQLISIAEDEDYGDYTDIVNGRDFTINAVKEIIAGREGIKCNLQIKPKQTPLHTDKTLVEKLLNEQPNILEVNSRYKQTYDSLKETLMKWLNPEAETEAEGTVTGTVAPTEEEEDDEIEEDLSSGQDLPPVEAKAAPTASPKKAKNTDKFNELFKD